MGGITMTVGARLSGRTGCRRVFMEQNRGSAEYCRIRRFTDNGNKGR